MQFSIFFEIQPSDGDRASEAALFKACADQAVLADELGFDRIWAVEHHGLYEHSHLSAPEVFLSYVAGRTKRIRLGHGVTLLPYRIAHPLKVAARIATLDVLSDGRVDWGTGKGSSRTERLAFGCDDDQRHAEWRQALSLIPKMWRDEVFEHHSALLDIEPIQVIPKPVQEPHPPMFAACSRPECVDEIGALGLGVLAFGFAGEDLLSELVTRYRVASKSAKTDGWQQNEHFACAVPTLVHENDDLACQHGFRGFRYFMDSLLAYYGCEEQPIGRLAISRDELTGQELSSAKSMRQTPGSLVNAIVGDPASAKRTIEHIAKTGVDEILLLMQMGTVPHELVLRSMRLFAEQVMPHFR